MSNDIAASPPLLPPDTPPYAPVGGATPLKTSFLAVGSVASAHDSQSGQGMARIPLAPPMAMNASTLIANLEVLQNQAFASQVTVSKEEIKVNVTQMNAANAQYLDKLKESLEQQSKAGTWQKASKWLGWIGEGASLVVGAALIATGVGAVAGGLLIASAVVGIGKDIAESIPAAQTWMDKHKGVEIALTVLQVGLGLAGGVTAFFAAGAATAASVAGDVGDGIEMTDLGEQAATTGEEVGQATTETTQGADQVGQFAAKAGKVANVVQGVDQVGTGVTTGGTGYHQYEGTKATADSQDDQADITKLQQLHDSMTAAVSKLCQDNAAMVQSWSDSMRQSLATENRITF